MAKPFGIARVARMCWFLICCVLILSGCISRVTKGDMFAEVAPPPPDKSLVYFYHLDSSYLDFGPPTIMINNKPLVILPKLGYSYVYLRPGVYRFDLKNLGIIELSTEFLVTENQTSFMRLSYRGGITLTKLPREQALPEIAAYRYVEPLNTEF
jgi:hypothetical protein